MRENRCGRPHVVLRSSYSNVGFLSGVMHHSYKARKSSLETVADVGVGCGDSRRLEHAPSVTMLAQDGATQAGVLQAGLRGVAGPPPPPASLPSIPKEGEAGRRGGRHASMAMACLYLPSTPGRRGNGR
jgi:hypothetical protein